MTRKIKFIVEITAATSDEVDDAYHALISAAIDIAIASPTAMVLVMDIDEDEMTEE